LRVVFLAVSGRPISDEIVRDLKPSNADAKFYVLSGFKKVRLTQLAPKCDSGAGSGKEIDFFH
jgi:hypothetical protein